MESTGTLPAWSAREELAHALSHGLGALLALGGLIGLVVAAARHGDAWHLGSAWVYGVTLVLLYAASTLYHALPHPRAKRLFRLFDHAAIYLLIAGTYTPFTLGPLRGPWGWALFGIVWAGAAAGIVFKCVALGRAPRLSVALYVLMGWCVVFALGPLARALAPGGLALVFGGGLCYTVGVVFYAWPRLRFGHFVWHLFVLAGSVLHYLAVLLFVIPRPA